MIRGRRGGRRGGKGQRSSVFRRFFRGVNSRTPVDICSMQNRGSELRHNHVVPALTVFSISVLVLCSFLLFLFFVADFEARGIEYVS